MGAHVLAAATCSARQEGSLHLSGYGYECTKKRTVRASRFPAIPRPRLKVHRAVGEAIRLAGSEEFSAQRISTGHGDPQVEYSRERSRLQSQFTRKSETDLLDDCKNLTNRDLRGGGPCGRGDCGRL
jgi:hypothetical protein